MTQSIATSQWWLRLDEPTAVKAVLSLASMRQDEDDEVHDAACAVYGPQAEVVIALANTLSTIEQLMTDDPAEVLARVAQRPVHGPDLLGAAEKLAEQMRCDAVTDAQLVASVSRIGRAA